MSPFKSKQGFRRLSIFVLILYIILCLTAGGFHAFDEYAYHDHNSDSCYTEKTDSDTAKAGNNESTFCRNDHSEDRCIICKWLKSTPRKTRVTQVVSYFIPVISRLCASDQQAYNFLSTGKYYLRSPPSNIS